MNYLIGQRVIINNAEIGTVCVPINDRNGERLRRNPNSKERIWVFSPSKQYESYYCTHNIKPLPGGQL